jgi:hypothetical protein
MYVADRHSWACNLSTYIKTPAPPLIIPSFHHSQTLHKQYTSSPPLPTTTINTPRRLTSYQPRNQTTQWPPLPTTSPQWHQTTFLHAQDHHQHVLCLQFPRNRCGRFSNLLIVQSASACGASPKSNSTKTSDIQYTTIL